jgi:type IV secretory pathway component VirB8
MKESIRAISFEENVMTLDTLLQTDLWREFQKQARTEKRSPVDLLGELIKEYLEIKEDATMHEAMSREARKSGYTEADAVDVVRQVRAMRKKDRGA